MEGETDFPQTTPFHPTHPNLSIIVMDMFSILHNSIIPSY